MADKIETNTHYFRIFSTIGIGKVTAHQKNKSRNSFNKALQDQNKRRNTNLVKHKPELSDGETIQNVTPHRVKNVPLLGRQKKMIHIIEI